MNEIAQRKASRYLLERYGTTRAVIRGATRTRARVFRISKVEGAHAHRFRHTLATALLEKGWTMEDVANVLGSTPETIRKHYAMDSSAAGTYFKPGAGRMVWQVFGKLKKIVCNY
jgi:integrase